MQVFGLPGQIIRNGRAASFRAGGAPLARGSAPSGRQSRRRPSFAPLSLGEAGCAEEPASSSRSAQDLDARAGNGPIAEAEAHVGDFLRAAGVAVQPIQPETAHLALEAFARYGKRRGHPARLNLGDCFIYAQAKLSGAKLLYKGDDFSKTDIESAS
jgi:ribonuclease VapC